MIVFVDNCIFEGYGYCNLLVFVIRIMEDFNVGFFKLLNKFYVFDDVF